MSLVDPQIPKEYQNGRVLFEQNLDAWRESVEDYFATINLNLTQLRKDAFLANYDFDNDGNANLPKNLQQQINDLTSGATPIGGTTSDTWTINSDGNSSILSTAGLTAVRTYTFPDASGVLVVANSTQTLSNKTFSDNIVWSSGVASTGTLDHANTANRTYTFPDFSGTIVLNGSGGSVPFLGNVDVYNGFDFRAYSDAGITQTVAIDGATGTAIFGSSSVGAATNLTIRNTDNTNGASSAFLNIITGGAVAGDPVLFWSTGATTYGAAINNSDNDRWQFYNTADPTVVLLNYDPSLNSWGMFTASPAADFDIAKAVSAGTVSDRVLNSDNTNIASHSSRQVQVGGAAAGDPYFLWTIGGTQSWYMGIDNSDSDRLKIGTNQTVGAQTAVTFNTATLETLLVAVDPPTANYMNSNSSVKSFCAVDGPTGNLIAGYDDYNIFGTARTALGTFLITLDTDHSQPYIIGTTTIEAAPVPGVSTCAYVTNGTYNVFIYDVLFGGVYPGAAVDHDFCTWTFGVQ